MKSRLTVAKRLSLGFGVVLLISTLTALLGGWGLARVNASLQSVFAENTVPLQRLATVRDLAARDRILLTDAILQARPDLAGQRVGQYRRNRAKAEKAWQDFSTSITGDQQMLADATAQAAKALVTEGFEPAAAELAAGRFDAARQLLDRRVGPLYPAFSDAMDDLVAQQVDAAEVQFNAAQEFGERFTLIIAVLAGIGLLAGICAAVWVTRHLVRALGAEPDSLAAVAERIALGELTDDGAPAALAGSVMASMQKMRASLVRVVDTVRSGVQQVAGASAEIAQGSQALSGRTDEQASSLQRTATSMEQFAGTVGASADNARRANQFALGASEVAARGGAVVAQVVETMARIQADSKKIADITGVIDGIAFQTNLLALNAAVEAARAGHAGRSFAVVAGEVRMLAQRSAKASRQIKGLIQDSVQRVDAGGAQVKAAGETMADIVAQVRQVSDLIGEITAASHEQSQGIAEVGKAMGELDTATQQNAALVQHSTAAAESLMAQASRLSEAVSVFRLAPAAGP